MKRFIDVIINLHDEGGEGAASQGGENNSSSGTATSAEIPGSVSRRAHELGIGDDLLEDYNKAFGKTEKKDSVKNSETQEKAAQDENSAPDSSSEFDKLINEKYRSEYDNRVQKLVKDRMSKSQKQIDSLQGQLDSDNEIFAYIAQKYGIDPTNRDELLARVKGDADYFTQTAAEKGTTAEDELNSFTTKRENDRRDMELESLRRDKQAQELHFRLQDLALETQKVYPDFNLQKELQDPEFQAALDFLAARNEESNRRNGTDNEIFNLTRAYEITHADEIQKNTVKKIGNAALSAVAQSIQSNSRPHEGLSSQKSARIEAKSISDMSEEEFDRLYEDVKAGRRKIPT